MILHARDTEEPGSKDSVLPAIVKTGRPELDRFHQALAAASFEDVVLLAIAANRNAPTTSEPSSPESSRACILHRPGTPN